MYKINLIDADNNLHVVTASDGESVLQAAKTNFTPLEGLCGGEMDCSTCHIFVKDEWTDRLSPTSEDEEDMLDLLPNCQSSSRLACQIFMRSELDGFTAEIAPKN